jgi:predicted TIM-barrel fold metal-dependent hydrolase
MIVDLHAHDMPADYIALAKTRKFGGSYRDSFTGHSDKNTLDQRFAMMDDAGVVRQVLSPTCAPYTDDVDVAVRASRMINDHFAELQRAHPDRFQFWVSVPLPHVAESIAEVRRGLDELGGVGVVLGCFCLNESIAQERFEPLYAELNARALPVFLHPCQNGICSPLVNEWGLTVCAGASFEDSVAALQLIARGIPTRYPNLRFIVPHFGGILPTLLNRLDGQMPRNGSTEAPSVTAKGFYYDTVGWGSRAALIAAVEAFGPGQIVTGSDYPVLLFHESYKQTFDNIRNSGLPDEQIGQILENAGRLLSRGVAAAS